ncbi:MAG: Asp23/Gls24 family envelope stress response protein [Anaerolineae bacterium]
MTGSTDTELGRIEVAPSAIAHLVSQVAVQCYGVVGLAARTLRGGIAQLLHRGEEAYRKGVQVRIDEDHVAIDLYVILEHGTRISEVARNVMETVQYAVERSLGIPVAEVNVHVQGLRIQEQP